MPPSDNLPVELLLDVFVGSRSRRLGVSPFCFVRPVVSNPHLLAFALFDVRLEMG